jgi:hypothetical protein
MSDGGVTDLAGRVAQLEQRLRILEDGAGDAKAKYPPPVRGLRSAEEISARFGLSGDRLRELCAAGLAPHYRIDGSESLFFKMQEFSDWFDENCIAAREGMAMPRRINVIDFCKRSAAAVPARLSQMDGLLEVPVGDALCGVYFLCDRGDVVYVGKSVNVIARVATHATERRKDFGAAFFLPAPPSEIDGLEAEYAKLLKPKYNTREDGSVFW